MPTSKKEIALSYFIRDPEGGPNGYICQCGTRRTQHIKKGYQNLASHVFAQHSDYEEVMKKKVEGNAIHQFVNSKAQKVFVYLVGMDLNAEPTFLGGRGSVNSSFSKIQSYLPEHFNDIHQTRYSRDREQDKGRAA
jgi:hypothetical protein